MNLQFKKLILKSVTISGSLLLSLTCIAQNISISVSPKKNCHSISPYIYGINSMLSDSSVTAIRQGGNRWTTFNWETGLSNSGKDFNNVSDNYLSSSLPNSVASNPGAVATYNHNIARNYNQYFLTTVQAQGYVVGAAGAAGVVTSAPSKYWFKVLPQKNAPFSLSPELTDSNVYIDEYINFLKTKHGLAKNGGINGYSIDNEPDLWYETHPKVQAKPQKINSLITKTLQTSIAIKSVDSTAEIFGPALANWYGCKNFNGNDNTWFSEFYSKYKSEWFVSVYLDTMRVLSKQYGKRLIDAIDIHWYPEATGADGIRIVNTSGGSEPITKEAIKARLQNPRSLWDANYIEKSGFENGTKPIQLLTRIKASIDAHFPGTKMAITEYRWGTENHYSGGLALADVLGVFGREGVYFASKWYASGSAMFQPYSKAAFDLYRNFDGKHSSFGTTSIEAIVSSNDTLSTVASIDKDNYLHIIAINKMPSQTSCSFLFNDAYYTCAAVYGFDSTSAIITQRDSIKSISNYTQCQYSLPAYSALHFIFKPFELPQIISAKTDSINTKTIIVLFNKNIKNETIALDAITIKNNKDTLNIQSITISSDTIKIGLNDDIQLQFDSLTFSCKKVLHDQSDITLDSIFEHPIINILKGSKPSALQAQLNKDGKTICIQFSKEIKSIDISNISISNQFGNVNIKNISYSSDSLIVILEKSQTQINILYAIVAGVIFTDQTSFGINDKIAIENYAPDYSFGINSSEITNQGLTINLQFNKMLSPKTDLSKITVTINDVKVSFNSTITGTEAILSLNKKIDNNDVAKVSYIDNGYITAIDGSYLEDYSSTLNNNLPIPPPRITIPAKIENEVLYYSLGTVSIKNETTSSNGQYVQFNTNDKIAYRIEATKDTLYSINFSYASGNSSLIIKIDSTDIDTIAIPQTISLSSFLNYGILKNLSKGNHTIEITNMANPFNIDYLDIVYGKHLPTAEVTNANIGSTGLIMNVDFNGFVKEAPDPDSFTLTSNDNPIDITSISIVSNITLRFKLADTIYKKEAVVLSLKNPSVETKNESSLSLFTRSIKNSSTVVKVGSKIANPYFFSLISENKLTHNFPETSIICFYNIIGKKVLEISALNNIISLNEIPVGCYFVTATNRNEIIYQNKLILSK